MATLTNKKKLAAVDIDIEEKLHRNNLSRDTIFPKVNKENIT